MAHTPRLWLHTELSAMVVFYFLAPSIVGLVCQVHARLSCTFRTMSSWPTHPIPSETHSDRPHPKDSPLESGSWVTDGRRSWNCFNAAASGFIGLHSGVTNQQFSKWPKITFDFELPQSCGSVSPSLSIIPESCNPFVIRAFCCHFIIVISCIIFISRLWLHRKNSGHWVNTRI